MKLAPMLSQTVAIATDGSAVAASLSHAVVVPKILLTNPSFLSMNRNIAEAGTEAIDIGIENMVWYIRLPFLIRYDINERTMAIKRVRQATMKANSKVFLTTNQKAGFVNRRLKFANPIHFTKLPRLSVSENASNAFFTNG